MFRPITLPIAEAQHIRINSIPYLSSRNEFENVGLIRDVTKYTQTQSTIDLCKCPDTASTISSHMKFQPTYPGFLVVWSRVPSMAGKRVIPEYKWSGKKLSMARNYRKWQLESVGFGLILA